MPTYSEQLPAISLSRWIECVWFLTTDTEVIGYRVPPDACLDIIYDRYNGLRAIGAMTSEQRFDLATGTCLLGIRFRPGMSGPFLGIPSSKLTDSSTSLKNLWSGRARELTRPLEDAPSMQEAMRCLINTLQTPATAPSPVQQAIEAMVNANGTAGLISSARQANLSARQFRRRCLEESGLTPKLLSRILRFRHACCIARAAERPNWSAIAVQSEYFDQVHLIRDFREFGGATPMAVFSNTHSGVSISLKE